MARLTPSFRPAQARLAALAAADRHRHCLGNRGPCRLAVRPDLPEPFAVVQAGVTLAASGELWQHVKVSRCCR